MKSLYVFFVCMILTINGLAQVQNTLTRDEFQAEKKKLTDNIAGAKKIAGEAKRTISEYGKIMDSLNREVSALREQTVLLNDSLTKTAGKLYGLQEKINEEKHLSSTAATVLFVIAALLVVILFILLVMVRRTLSKQVHHLEDADREIRDKEEKDARTLDEEYRQIEKKINSLSQEMEARISKAHAEAGNAIREATEKMKSATDTALKEHHEEHIAFSGQTEKKMEGLSEKITSLTSALQKTKDTLSGDLDALRNLIRQEVQKHTDTHHKTRKE